MRRSSHTPIGVDVGQRTIKVAQLVRAGSSYRVHALALVPRPNVEQEVGHADALALREVLHRQGFRGRQVVLAAPEEHLLRAALELPAKVSGAPAEQIIRMELSRLHNVAPDSFEMAYWDLKGTTGAKPMAQMLAVGCPHAAANALLDVFEGAAFRVAALDVRSAAAVRVCQPLVLPVPQITAIVDFGWRSSRLLFACGQSLIYERSLDGVCTAELTGRLMEAFGIPLESAYQIVGSIRPAGELSGPFDPETLEAVRQHMRSHFDRLMGELRTPLSYANRQFPGEGVKRLLLIGGGATVPYLMSYCQERLGLEIRTASPSDLVDSPPELLARANNPALTMAVGLAQAGGA